jgi:hypothetical protein
MNASELAANWGRVRLRLPWIWDRLTEQDLLYIDGRFERLVDALRVRYGFGRAEAERTVRELTL